MRNYIVFFCGLCMTLSSTFSSAQIQLEIMASEVSFANSEFVGHAFMTISIPTSTGIKEDSYGFYPRADGSGIINGNGIVNSELDSSQRSSRFSRISVSIKKVITEEQRRDILKLANEWNDKHYRLLDNSCIDFIIAAAGKAGWIVPEKISTELPESYVKKLKFANDPSLNVLNSTWILEFDISKKPPTLYEITFAPNKVLIRVNVKTGRNDAQDGLINTWDQKDETIWFSVNSSFASFKGTLNGSEIKGVAQSKSGSSWNFRAKRK